MSGPRVPFTDEYPTSYRDRWTTTTLVSKLFAMAQLRAEYHESRSKHWAHETEVALQAYESSIQTERHEVTGGKQLGVKADQEAAQHWQKCEHKLEEHRRLAREFRIWVMFFEHEMEHDAKAILKATASDLLYFAMPAVIEAETEA